MEFTKELLKILRKTWLPMFIVALLMAISLAFLIKTAPRTLGPVIKEFKEAIR
jgi:hypothetical protein